MLVKILCNFFIVCFVFFYSLVTFAMSGEDVYKSYCITCHSPQMSKVFQAPTAHSNDWVLRKGIHWDLIVEKNFSFATAAADVKEKIIIDSLLESAIKGTPKGMPPRGVCMDCSNEELRSAIIFMISS